MEFGELDLKLRQLNDIEIASLEQRGRITGQTRCIKLRERFSETGDSSAWIINSGKLMKPSEVIAVHRHDRFTAFDRHKHDYLEMTFVYSGSIFQNIDGKELEIRKGEIILLDMNVEHSIKEAGEEDIAINILIRKEFFDWMFLKEIAYNDLISDFIVKAIYGRDEARRYIYFKTSGNDRVWSFMIQILMEYYDKRNGMETAIRAYILLLFNELLRDYEKHLSSQIVYQIDSDISKEIISYINNHSRELSLKEMSAHFNYSPDHFGKLVKKVTGRNLTDFVREQRLKKAEYLLKNTEMTVTDIAYEAGYSNVTHFYRQFREKLDTTPDEYRRMLAGH